MAQYVFKLPEGAACNQRPGLLDEFLVVPAVGHQELEPPLLGQAYQMPRLLSARRHRLLAHHVEPLLQGRPRVLVVQGVRRSDHDAIQLAVF